MAYMLRTVAALLVGELLLLSGLWFAWWPLALIVAGSQLVSVALLVDHPDSLSKAGGES